MRGEVFIYHCLALHIVVGYRSIPMLPLFFRRIGILRYTKLRYSKHIYGTLVYLEENAINPIVIHKIKSHWDFVVQILDENQGIDAHLIGLRIDKPGATQALLLIV